MAQCNNSQVVPIISPILPELLNRKRKIEKFIRPMAKSTGISNPVYNDITVQYGLNEVQQDQNYPHIQAERVTVKVIQKGEVNGQNEEIKQKFSIRLRSDLC